MIYKVSIQAPAIDEEVTLAADDEEHAIELAVASTMRRQAAAATVTVEPSP
jgi:1,2-phenylacetyl-CoA epoxidase PaaB subunit